MSKRPSKIHDPVGYDNSVAADEFMAWIKFGAGFVIFVLILAGGC